MSQPSPQPSDDDLLARSSRGDREALEQLFQRYRLAAYRVAHRLLGNEADALDAVQDGFIKALTHLSGFQGRSSFKTWLLRVVSNSALDLGRQRGRREGVSLDSPAGAEAHDRLFTLAEASSVEPVPIPGGFAPGLHAFLGPGVEPSTIFNFRGVTGVAAVRGTGTAWNTRTGAKTALLFDSDNRFMQGTYVGADGERHRGTFGFV